MSEPCQNANYLVLHFQRGQLVSTKLTHSWRGAQMSKRNFERMFKAAPKRMLEYYDPTTRIISMQDVLALKGLDAPDTDLNTDDLKLLRKMGIGIK